MRMKMSRTSIAQTLRWWLASLLADALRVRALRLAHVVPADGGGAADGVRDRAALAVTRAADVRRRSPMLCEDWGRAALRRGSFLLLLLIGNLAAAQELPSGVKLVAPGVWFVAGGDSGSANATVIEMPEYLIVVDGGFPGRAKELLAMLPKLSPKPVRYAFDTHAHGDHAYGNAVWTSAGAETMAFAGVKDDMDRWEPARWQKSMTTREDVKATGESDVERPKKVLEGDRFTLAGGGRTVEFLHFGWGHTTGDGYVWLPKDRVLATGDAAVNGPYNYLGDAWIEQWPRLLEAAIQLRPLVVLPGHGAGGGAEILVGQRRFLIDLDRVVQEEIAFGRTPEQMHFHLPEWDKSWEPANLLPDIQACYAELRQHQPMGAIVSNGN